MGFSPGVVRTLETFQTASELDPEALGAAIRWLEAMASDDPEQIHAFAERKIEEKAWADAASALRRAIAIEGGQGGKATRALMDRVDDAAREDAEKFEALQKKRAEVLEAQERAEGLWMDAQERLEEAGG